MVSFYISSDSKIELEALADEHGVSKAAVYRAAVDAGIAAIRKRPKLLEEKQ